MATYFKSYQRADLWNYYKLFADRQPPACEVVNFLGELPMIELREYDLSSPGSKIDYDALWEVGERIAASEYEAIYKRATSGPFTLYINGKPQ
ncbi:hypothetical protein [Spirosoma areae]